MIGQRLQCPMQAFGSMKRVRPNTVRHGDRSTKQSSGSECVANSEDCRNGMPCVDQSVAGGVRGTVHAAHIAADEMPKAAREGSDLFFQLLDMSHQLVFAGKATEVETDHFKRTLRRLAAGPQSNQHAGNDG